MKEFKVECLRIFSRFDIQNLCFIYDTLLFMFIIMFLNVISMHLDIVFLESSIPVKQQVAMVILIHFRSLDKNGMLLK